MKRTIIYTLLLLFSIATTSAQPSSSERWDAGNKAYMAGAYNQATEEYHAILDGGEYSLELQEIGAELSEVLSFHHLALPLRW